MRIGLLLGLRLCQPRWPKATLHNISHLGLLPFMAWYFWQSAARIRHDSELNFASRAPGAYRGNILNMEAACQSRSRVGKHKGPWNSITRRVILNFTDLEQSSCILHAMGDCSSESLR